MGSSCDLSRKWMDRNPAEPSAVPSEPSAASSVVWEIFASGLREKLDIPAANLDALVHFENSSAVDDGTSVHLS